jgi:hypothetical protein
MKKILTLLLFIFIIGSCNDPFEFEYVKNETPDNLVIENIIGIKLETQFITDEVRMNVKTDLLGNHIIKITDITGNVVSKEEVMLTPGDNVLVIYTNTLPSAGYRIGLYDLKDRNLGITDFNKL